jgi:tRNA uridine 5-carboxymethylaminomethyl modification enzyme
MKYQGYINKEQDMVDKMNKLEHIALDADYDYSKIQSLSSEARQKLTKIKQLRLVRPPVFPVFRHQIFQF